MTVKERALIYLSLVVSVAALCYATWVHQHSEQMAVQALRRRETELVTSLAPKVRTVYLDMLGKTNAFAAAPTTLEELLRPLLTIVERVGELPEDSDKTEKPK
jgi:hypothetical protein